VENGILVPQFPCRKDIFICPKTKALTTRFPGDISLKKTPVFRHNQIRTSENDEEILPRVYSPINGFLWQDIKISEVSRHVRYYTRSPTPWRGRRFSCS